MSVAAGWYTDPGQTGHLRWWDGQQWTEHIRAPAPAPTAPAAAFALPDAAVSPVGGLGVTSARVAVGSLDPCLPSSTTAILPVHSGGRRAPAVRGWQRPAAVAALVGILAVGGFLGFRTLTSSASPTVTPTAPAVAAPIAAPVDARKAATILDTFKPHDNTPAPGVTSTLVPPAASGSSSVTARTSARPPRSRPTRPARRRRRPSTSSSR